jgi:K+-sensing histidine kinase KdpD
MGLEDKKNHAVNHLTASGNAATKILVVQDGEYLAQVTEYALKMAQRLDCDIIALDVTDIPLHVPEEQKESAINSFQEKASKNSANFTTQAATHGVNVRHMMEIGNQEDIIARLSEEDSSIRYVLTKPEDEYGGGEEQTHVPVYDLNCSRLAS